mgnify:CR=1 FL=1
MSSWDRPWDTSWLAEPLIINQFLQPNQWQKERGYDPNKATTNPKARFHANGRYATGIYKKWLEGQQ